MKKTIDSDLPSCESCIYIDIELKDIYGYCRRYPPVLITKNDEVCSSTPVVERAEWCGEFKRRTS